MKREKGLTLVEVMVAVSIASILTVGIGQLLETALTSWRLALEEAAISKLSEDAMRQMMEGDYEFTGIRDAVELTDVKEASVTFVPLWTDIFDMIPKDGKFYLTKGLRAGAPPPTSEIKFRGSPEFIVYPVTVHWEGSSGQWVEFGFPVKQGATVRLSYQPDVKIRPELAMRYEWDKAAGKINRFYNRTVSDFNLRGETVRTNSVQFSYYDGNNRVVDISGKKLSKANALIRISAVKIDLEFQGKELSKQASSLVNIRTLGKSGQGIILAEGLEIPLPDSEHIRLLQLMNFAGVEEGQTIELKISQPLVRRAWRIKLYLGLEGSISVLRRYEIFYPADELVFEQTQPTSLANGLDFLTLGAGGLHDYDDDEGVTDKVQFNGEQVTLSVLRTDPDGVMLIVRP